MWVYEIEELLTFKRKTVHDKRLLIYRGDMDRKYVNPDLLKAAEHTEASYYTDSHICDIRCIANKI